jgi:hypothetical protein
MSRKYVILTAAEADNIDYSLVMEDSAESLRWNNDNTETFIKWEGTETPSFCDDKTQYNHSEILTILNNPAGDWVKNDEI